MDFFSEALNDFLVNVFHSILKAEETMLRRGGDISLSISELHLLDAVGRGTAAENTVSALALRLGITTPSVTVAVNKLAGKGCLQKSRSDSDGRNVHVGLTETGQSLFRDHQEFHRRMVESMSAQLSEAEKTALLQGVQKLSRYFDSERSIP